MSTTYDDYLPTDAERGPSLRHYGAVLRRRWKAMAITTALITFFAVAVAFLIPAEYRSTATILIQEQEIPPDLVRSTVTSYADERIQVISQEVLASSVLISLIEKYNLYASRRRTHTNEEVLDRMRTDIQLRPISADVVDHRSGNQVKATIAFKLSYQSTSPDSAQKIANELVSLYLNENVKNREERAAETSSFLDEESDRLAKHIADLETKLADFKSKNEGRLPELRQLNMSQSDRNDSELIRIEHDISQATERRSSLEAELALTAPNTVLPGEGEEKVVLQPEERLKSLKAQLAAITGAYTEDHPDIKRLKREIRAMEDQGFGADTSIETQKRIDALTAQLSQLRQKYGDDYPDIQRIEREIRALREAPVAPIRAPRRVAADNPVYLNLQSQIDEANAQLKSLGDEKRKIEAKQQELETRLEQTPEVERQYLELTRDHENSQARFREMKEKQMQAQIAEQLERDRKAERFTLIEPPQYPERPASPNRPVIVLVGFFLALAGGVGAGALREALDASIKEPDELSRLFGAPVLSVVPATITEVEAAPWQRYRLPALVTAGVLVVVALIHFFVIPLDVAWYSVMRRVFS